MEKSRDVVIGMLWVFDHDVYTLLNLGVDLNFVTPYLFMSFDVSPKILLEPYLIYTPISDSMLAKRVYRNC